MLARSEVAATGAVGAGRGLRVLAGATAGSTSCITKLSNGASGASCPSGASGASCACGASGAELVLVVLVVLTVLVVLS